MPIELDKKPGGANGLTARQAPETPEGQGPKLRIRILRAINSRYGAYKAGEVVEVEISVARSWIGFGIAEQEKMLSGPPEVKTESPAEHPGNPKKKASR